MLLFSCWSLVFVSTSHFNCLCLNPKELIRPFCPFPTYFLFFIIGIKQWKILSQAIDKCYLDLVGKSMCQSYGLDPSMETIPKIQIIYRAVHKFSIIFIQAICCLPLFLILITVIFLLLPISLTVLFWGVFFCVCVSDFPALSHQKFKVV